ncbi:MAG TPA: hypothetical protein VLQ46_02125 [Casimicrobiaceae bacterium]|nr:hypothetical protein [Casimicrobiaceae bacterium]
MIRAGLILCACIAVGAALAADAPESVKGSFKSKAVTLQAKSAIAYRGRSFLGSGDALIVVVTNARVHPDALAEYYDRRRVVEKRIRAEETGVVYIEFRPDGSYRGLSYTFAPGNGCGFCTSEVASTVRLANGRLTGNLKGSEKDRPFDLTIDVPLMSDDHGPALPADGGAPGTTYLAYHTALVKRDRAALKNLLSADRRETWSNAEKKGQLDAFIDYLISEHPEKSVRVTRGYAKADTAVLLVAGESVAGKLAGEVLLMREDNAWRVDDELMELESR